MGKSTYKKEVQGTGLRYLRDDLLVRQFLCMQKSHIRDIKRRINRSQRRKDKQNLGRIKRDYYNKDVEELIGRDRMKE